MTDIKNRFVAFAIFLSLGFLSANRISAAEPDGTKISPAVRQKIETKLNEYLADLHNKTKFPGGSLAVVLPDGSEVAVTVGFADKEKKRPMKPTDRMMSGSIGKTYFAALALKLISEKKLALDDKVSKYLGKKSWFKKLPNAEDVTIGHLMRHQSGIPRYVFSQQFWKELIDNPEKKWNGEDQISYILEKPAVHPAGKGWAYSDTNYIILGLVMEKITGKNLYRQIEKQILKPLGLKDTFPNDSQAVKKLTQGYSVLFKRLGVPELVVKDDRFVINPQFEWCGGGFYSTPMDLARWARLLFSDQAFAANYLKEMTANAADASRILGPNTKYGCGVMIRKTKLGTMLGHDGVFPGYSSSMGYLPAQKISAAFQINTDNSRPLRKPMHRVLVEAMKIVETELKQASNQK